MNTLYRRLGDGLPERRNPGKDSFQAEARALKQWIEALPFANASATARLLYQALREMNQLRIDPTQRLQALEALRAPVAQIAETVDRQIIGSSFPLPPQKQQLGGIAQEFQRELALGYRIAVFDLCAPDGKVPFMRGKYATLALQRALAHLGAQLGKAYLVYATPPEGLWRGMHDLFRFGQFIKLDEKPVDDPLLGGAQFTPRQTYAHALLLAISNPYGLSQKDCYDSFAVTRVWAGTCELREGARAADANAIPLEEDRGPGYLPDERKQEDHATLAFGTAPLEQELERQLSLVNGVAGPISFRTKGGPPISVGVELIRRLMSRWRTATHRVHARLPAGHELDTLIGLTALHYHLSGLIDFESFVRRARGPGINLSDRDRAASWATQAGESGKPETFRATVLDQSLGGYRLEWNHADQVKTRVGELVGLAQIADDGETQDWMVGIICWIRINPKGRVDAGISLLAREARPAALRAIDADGRPKPPVRAIQLASLAHDQVGLDGYSIVAPIVLERTAAQFELTSAADPFSDDDETEVQILPELTTIEQTGTYLRLVPTRGEPEILPPTYAQAEAALPG